MPRAPSRAVGGSGGQVDREAVQVDRGRRSRPGPRSPRPGARGASGPARAARPPRPPGRPAAGASRSPPRVGASDRPRSAPAPPACSAGRPATVRITAVAESAVVRAATTSTAAECRVVGSRAGAARGPASWRRRRRARRSRRPPSGRILVTVTRATIFCIACRSSTVQQRVARVVGWCPMSKVRPQTFDPAAAVVRAGRRRADPAAGRRRRRQDQGQRAALGGRPPAALPRGDREARRALRGAGRGPADLPPGSGDRGPAHRAPGAADEPATRSPNGSGASTRTVELVEAGDRMPDDPIVWAAGLPAVPARPGHRVAQHPRARRRPGPRPPARRPGLGARRAVRR